MKRAIEENHVIMNAFSDKLREHDKIIKKWKKMEEKENQGGRMPNTKAAIKTSMNKKIDGKTMIAIAIYLIFKFWQSKYPSILDPVWGIAIDIGIWIICLLFNIDNPSVAKVFREFGQFILDLSLDPETAMNELRMMYKVIGPKYMAEFDKLGKKISEGVIETSTEEKKEAIKKELAKPDQKVTSPD